MKALVDSADQRGVVLSLLQIVGRLFDEVTRLLHERGIAAATAAARTPNTTTTTTVTAAQRGSRRFTSCDTAGSSPRATNIAAPTNTSTADAEPRTRTAPYVTATPAESITPR